MDKERCWEHVDQIIDFMDKGFRFLAPDEVVDEYNPTKNDVLYDDPNLEKDELKLLKAQELKILEFNEMEKQAVSKDRGAKRRKESIKVGLTPKSGQNLDLGSGGNTPNANLGADKL